MPYLRLYSQEIGIEQKRVIARKLIDVTLRAFQLRPEDSHRITIQFVPLPSSGSSSGNHYLEQENVELMLEVLAHDLTKEKKTAFAKQAADTLTRVMPEKASRRIARFFGLKPDAAAQVTIQFNALSPAISDPFIPELERKAA
jgi:hypothetical protein